jgi:predicted kinase
VTHVVVSGLPGAGKSTLAADLARRLRLPLLAMDPVKETLWDELGGGDVEHSRALGRAANEVVLSVAASAPATVLDSFWRHEWAVDQLKALPGEFVEVFCDCPADQARERYRERHRHPAHLDEIRVHDPDPWADHRARALSDEAIVVDTGAPVDPDGLVALVTAHPRWDAPVGGTGSFLGIVSGLPGTGKSLVADALSDATRAPVLGRDVVGAALFRSGVTPLGDPDGVAFELLGRMAAEQLEVGSAAILDSVGGNEETRARWRALAETYDVRLVVIECVCSDERVHRDRIDGRKRGIPGWYELTWEHVERVRSRYEPWPQPRLVLNAIEPAENNIATAVRFVRSTRTPPGRGRGRSTPSRP